MAPNQPIAEPAEKPSSTSAAVPAVTALASVAPPAHKEVDTEGGGTYAATECEDRGAYDLVKRLPAA
eukprot:scaffold64073_cov57-Phaeocystis_antarctica.AAC.5